MKKQLLGLSLFAATATVVALYPTLNSSALTSTSVPTTTLTQPTSPLAVPARPKIEIVFALDTTGSMSGLLAAAKEKIWSIASTMAQADPAPEIRVGLVAYRDRGDAYVTQMVDLSEDLDSTYAKLMDFTAGGGGDGPESVNQALADAVQRMSWSTDDKTYKVVFLVGDAPPHMDYANELQYPAIVKLANSRGIVINAVRCGLDENTRQAWQQIASLSQGDFFDVEHDGNAVAVLTPYDASIAALSVELDGTRMSFGSDKEQQRHAAKQKATHELHAKASVASRARRASFNATESGARNFLGDNDLVEAVAAGRVNLTTAAPASLPAELRMMAPTEREIVVKKQSEKRAELKAEIFELAAKRDTFITDQLTEEGGAKESFDNKIYDSIRRQAAEVGLSYDAPAKY